MFTAEDRHNLALQGLGLAQMTPLGRKALSSLFGPPKNTPTAPGPTGTAIHHPIGLPAGFDKNCTALLALEALGFAFLIGGTVVPEAQPGNPKPRAWRVPQDRAIINAMGFPSQGAKQVARNLEKTRHKLSVPLGISAGKQKDTPLTEAWRDYVSVIWLLDRYADFWEVNVSSPNTVGLRDLQGKDYLRRLLSAVREETSKPILVKVSPDLQEHELIEIIEVCQEEGINGLDIGNTTSSRYGRSSQAANVLGGWSGPDLISKSLPLVRMARHHAPNLYLIGTGGIFYGADVLEMIEAGADAVSAYTGFVYRGPRFLRSLLSEMA